MGVWRKVNSPRPERILPPSRRITKRSESRPPRVKVRTTRRSTDQPGPAEVTTPILLQKKDPPCVIFLHQPFYGLLQRNPFEELPGQVESTVTGFCLMQVRCLVEKPLLRVMQPLV